MDELRLREDKFKKLIAGIELRELTKERSQGYLNRVREFLDGYDDSLEKVDFILKRQMAGLLFQNIKIAPPVGGSRLEKRVSFSLFEPYNFIFSGARAGEKNKRIQCKKQIPEKESTFAHSVVK